MKEINKMLLSNPLYWIILILSITVIIVCYFYGPKIIGFFGEYWTKKALKPLPKDKYTIINDIFIKVEEKTYQIDHVIISTYGIFSIETKQYNGYITGSKYDKKWVRHLKNKKIYYTNPIRQNYGHIKALAKLLNIEDNKIFNIVCIPSTAKLKINDDGEVVRCNTILNKILSYKNEIIDKCNEIENIIKLNNITDKDLKKQHIKNIKNNIIIKNKNYCPKCGSPLVERSGKYGNFKGCSNYPKCKYTEK